MATPISGNVRLVYGNHNHNETFTSNSSSYTRTNTASQYAAGGARALVAGAALDKGTMLSNDLEGVLMIKNANTAGSLFVSLDGGNNWDIKIPAGFVNLISVGPDHDAYVKTGVATQTSVNVASVVADGTINFSPSSAIATAGTYLMTPTDSPNNSSSGDIYLLKTTTDSAITGIVYGLDGTTKKDLATGAVFSSSTVVQLVSIVDYRYTLTEQ
jgi:hypothetical protein